MRKFLTILTTIVVALSVVADIVWLGLWAYEKRSTNISTMEVGQLHSSSVTTEDKAVLNINYYANKDKTGYEVFEIKFNSYTGVDKTKVFGYGVQYVNPKFVYDLVDYEDGFFSIHSYYGYFNLSDFTNYYDYSNGINYKATDNKLDDKSMILFDDDEHKTYAMQFLGDKKYRDEYVFPVWVKETKRYDLNLFSHFLYEAVKNSSLASGFYDFNAVFDVTDMFKFYSKDRFGNFTELTDNSFIDTLKTYMTCKLNISDSGMTVASQSMFNLVNGKNDFDISKVVETSDYFAQTQYMELTDNDFNYILNEGETAHKAVIKQSVLNNLNKLGITNVKITLNQIWQTQNGITLNKNDIDIKTLNLLSYKLIRNI